VIAVYQQKGIDQFDLIAGSLKVNLNVDTRNGGDFNVPAASFNQLRKQYDPKHIIQVISALPAMNDEYKLAVVDVDLYTRGLNFIFGLANPVRRIALVSIYRLSGPEFENRIAKEVVHEAGHLLGLDHCADQDCVMYFSNTIDDTDRKRKSLCKICRSKYEE
jgi:archaemetzincin